MNNNRKENYVQIAKIWQKQLNLEFINAKKNVRMSFKDIGAFCEFLAIDFYDGFIGGGSGGMGFDLMNVKTGKGVEVKSCCTIQNAKCKKCKNKYNDLFLTKCPFCNSTDKEIINDSRFGINAESFLDEYSKELFDSFILSHVGLVEHQKENSTILIHFRWFKISFENKKIVKKQLLYFENQAKYGKKNTCNLLPYSFDFFKLCPTYLEEIIMSINYKDLNITPEIIKDTVINKPLRIKVTSNLFTEEQILKITKLKTYNRKDNTIDSIDFTLNIPYKHKSLGKERGDTKINKYKKLKH